METVQKPVRQGGFSLVEILIAVTIMVLMGGVVVVNVFPMLFQSQRDRAGIDVGNLKQAVKIFQMREKRLPRESEWPDFLVNGSPSHPDPYVDPDQIKDGKILDPWDNEYTYKRLSSRDFDIISYGADGQPGGEKDDADIHLKKKE